MPVGEGGFDGGGHFQLLGAVLVFVAQTPGDGAVASENLAQGSRHGVGL